MKPCILVRAFARCLALCGLLSATAAFPQTTLYFVPSLNSDDQISELWSSVENWYLALTPMPVPANRLPGSGDTVIIDLSEYACIVDVPMVEVGTLDTAANIKGGNFLVQYINSSDTTFNGSTLQVQYQWTSDNDSLVNGTLDLESGGLLFLNGTTLSVNNSTLNDVGEIELMDGAEINFTAGTNALTVAAGGYLTSIGSNSIYNQPDVPLTIDNRNIIESDGGTLFIECNDTFWTNSYGKGYFTNATSNSVIEINGPFAVQTGCTNYITGPGTFELYNGITTIVNGILQVGTLDPNPGTLDYHAYDLSGSGAINITGSPGMPSALVWESGSFRGPPINVDSNSLLIITNIFQKNMSNSVIYNFGAATWLVDGNTLDLDSGAVFDNIGTFTAANSATIQGGAGANPSFFNNSGTFIKSGSSNSTSFAQDDNPSPSFYFNNVGKLDVETGALYMEWGTNAGQYNVAQNAQLHFWLGTNVQEANASYTGPGEFAIDSADFWLGTNKTMASLLMEENGFIDGPGDLTVTDSLTLTYGTLKGGGWLNVSSNASLLVATNPVNFYRNVNNAGAATLSSDSVLAGQPLTWNNLPGSTLDFFSSTSFSGFGTTVGYSGAPSVLNNAGTIINSGTNVATASISWTVTNSGSIIVNQYAMDFDDSLIQTAGNINVSPGATLAVSSLYGNKFQLQGGVLAGRGEVTGAIVNSATIHPGDSPGILTIGFGTLTNQSGANLAIDIGGTTPGLLYSQVNGMGSQQSLNNLDLTVTLDNGFVPALGQSFVIWTNAQLTGQLASMNGVQVSPGVILTPQYTASTLTLVAESSLVSPTFADQTFGFGLETMAGVTNIVEYTVSLSPPNWLPLTNFVGNGQLQTITDPAATNGTRFYRVIFEQP